MIKSIRCPVCNQKESVGFLKGSICRRYFCKYCCIEFTVKNEIIELFEVDCNGITILITDGEARLLLIKNNEDELYM